MASEQEPQTIAEALARLQCQLPRIIKASTATIPGKDGKRGYDYKYADLAAISHDILPLLGMLGMCFTAYPTVSAEGRFVLTYRLVHYLDPDNWIGGDYPLPSSASPQQIGSAITYARRYCLCAVTGLVADEDDDGAEAERGYPVNRDGSMSRSRTTDEQKTAAGVETDAERKAHSDLAEPPANTQPVNRLSTTPDDDPWTDGPAGLAPQDDPEDKPGSATKEQIQDIQALYVAGFRITDRTDKLETTRRFLGLDMLPSHTRLSYRQAGDLLLAMRHKLSEKAAK